MTYYPDEEDFLCSPEIEKTVLGCVLINSACLLDLATYLKAEDFFEARHRYIYEAMLAIYERDTANGSHLALDVVTLPEELRAQGHLEDAGGFSYVSGLIHATPSAVAFRQYAQIIKDKAYRRHVLNLAGDSAHLAHDQTLSVEDIQVELEKCVMNLGGKTASNHLQPLGSVLDGVLDELTSPKDTRLLSTGFSQLDQLLDGWHRGALYTVGGRTGQGKTALLLNFARNLSAPSTSPDLERSNVLIFSLEMSATDLAKRLLTSVEGKLTPASVRARPTDFSETVKRLGELPIWINDVSGLTIPQLRADVKRFMLRHPVGLVLVDYLQFVQPGCRVEKRYLEVGYVSRELKRLAREVDVPIVAASQLSRAIDHRQDKRPQLADLRESGQIEQDSDVVLFIHHLHPLRSSATSSQHPVELIVAKNRHGPTGTVNLWWNGERVSFRQQTKDQIHVGGIA